MTRPLRTELSSDGPGGILSSLCLNHWTDFPLLWLTVNPPVTAAEKNNLKYTGNVFTPRFATALTSPSMNQPFWLNLNCPPPQVFGNHSAFPQYQVSGGCGPPGHGRVSISIWFLGDKRGVVYRKPAAGKSWLPLNTIYILQRPYGDNSKTLSVWCLIHYCFHCDHIKPTSRYTHRRAYIFLIFYYLNSSSHCVIYFSTLCYLWLVKCLSPKIGGMSWSLFLTCFL